MQQAQRLRVRRLYAPQSITEQLCVDLLRVCNLFPAIRVDVDPQDARRAAELLRRYRLPFGVACGCTADNADQVATKTYYDTVIGVGAKFCWFFSCPAYGPSRPPRRSSWRPSTGG